MSAAAPAPAPLDMGVWYQGPAAFRGNRVRSNTQYTISGEQITIESGILTRKTEVLRWNQIKDVGFKNTCGMRCCCACSAGEIVIYCPGDASTGGMFSLYVPNARAIFEKMCRRIVHERKHAAETIGEYGAETGCCGCCESGGNYKIYTSHIELEHWSRNWYTVCGLFSDKNIDFVSMNSIHDLNKTETCCKGSFISIFVKDASSILHANAAAAQTKAKMDMAAYKASDVEYRLYVEKDLINHVFGVLSKKAGDEGQKEGQKEGPPKQMLAGADT
jgi:hypothetical protein